MTEQAMEKKIYKQATQKGFSIKKSRAAYSLDNQGGYQIINGYGIICAGENSI